MHSWIKYIIITVLAIAFIPLLINVTSLLTMKAITAITEGVDNLLAPLSTRGDGHLQGAIKLGLYIAAIIWLIQALSNRKGKE